MSIKQAFLKSNQSSLNKKSEVVEIDVASNYINDTHEVHEVSITREVQEGEIFLGRADLDAVKKGVSNVTKKKGQGPYRKYTDQDRAQTGVFTFEFRCHVIIPQCIRFHVRVVELKYL